MKPRASATPAATGRPPVAVGHAAGGSECWRAVVAAQRNTLLDHLDVADLADQMAVTLRAVEELAAVLCRHLEVYRADRTDAYLFALLAPLLRRPGLLTDDEGEPPTDRVTRAARQLAELHGHVRDAARAADECRSELRHLDVVALGTARRP